MLRSVQAYCCLYKLVPASEADEPRYPLFDPSKYSEKERLKMKEVADKWPHQNNVFQTDFSVYLNELSKDSKYKQKAWEKGWIRPFLLFVSMHPIRRIFFANSLQMNLLSSNKYGDSHWESWKLISNKLCGVESRIAEPFTEKLNPMANNCNWYEGLFRIANKAFISREKLLKKNNDVSKHLRTRIKSYKNSYKNTIIPCKDLNDRTLSSLVDPSFHSLISSHHS